jgi:predicted O-methyltransferase YrrM
MDVAGALCLLNSLLVLRRGREFDWAEDSVHWLLFAAYARSGKRINRILEIGTFDGEFTWMLSQFFPEAIIVTVDLPEHDPLLRELYDREDDKKYARYQALQQINIDQPKIQALKVNSLFLLHHATAPFDLIWVDGGHLYPEVAWDICQAWHLCAPGGAILCDDVINSHRHYRDDYVSTESFEVIEYLTKRIGRNPDLFLKRRNPEYHSLKHLRKYVARVIKPV